MASIIKGRRDREARRKADLADTFPAKEDPKADRDAVGENLRDPRKRDVSEAMRRRRTSRVRAGAQIRTARRRFT